MADNFAAFIVHRQTAPESRDWAAKLMGTNALWQSTDQTSAYAATGAGSRRRVREFRVSSDTFAELRRRPGRRAHHPRPAARALPGHASHAAARDRRSSGSATRAARARWTYIPPPSYRPRPRRARTKTAAARTANATTSRAAAAARSRRRRRRPPRRRGAGATATDREESADDV